MNINMDIRKDNTDHKYHDHVGNIKKHNDEIITDRDQIDRMFREAESYDIQEADRACHSEEHSPADKISGACYPEECCDAAEISDEDYERWKEGSEKGFWRTFIENR